FIYYAERGEYNSDNLTWYRYNERGQLERSPFQSIIHCFWWSIVTITTTGYGDVVPVTGIGKFIAGLTMSLGVLAIALPTTIIGSNFMAEWAVRRRSKFRHMLHKTHDKSFAKLTNVARSKLLQDQNDTILEAIAEIQDRLAQISPPDYYIRYKTFKQKHQQACERILELEQQLEKQKRITNNFDIFIRKVKSFNHNNNSDSLTADTNESNVGNDKKTLKFPHFKKSKTISSFGDSYATFHKNFINSGSKNIDTDNQSEIKPKTSKIFSIGSLKKKIARTFSTEDVKSSKHRKNSIDKIDISVPIEVRPTFTPIIDTSSITTTHSSIMSPPKEERPHYRRNNSSPEVIVTSTSADRHSGGSINLVVDNRQRGIFIQDTNSNHPIPLDNLRPPRIIKVDQGGVQNSTRLSSHNSNEGEMDRIEILVDDQ
ncbi:17486_t:CDS:1, partial [Cetraspora pellucida]